MLKRLSGFIVFLIILVLPFGQLASFELVGIGQVHFIDIFAFSLMPLCLTLVITKQLPVKGNWPLGIFWGVILLSWLVRINEQQPDGILVALFYCLRYIAYSLILPVVANCRLPWRRYLAISGMAVVVVGLVQYLALPDTRFLAYLGWDDHYYRLIGTLLDPNFTGIIIVCLVLLLTSVASSTRSFRRFTSRNDTYWLYVPMIVICFIALVLTYSRSSYLALLSGGIYLLAKKSPVKKVLFAVTLTLLCVLILFVIIPQRTGEGVNLLRTSSISARLEYQKKGIQLFLANPFLGIGYNYLPAISQSESKSSLPQHQASGFDNDFVFILATTGVVGLVAYAWMWLGLFKCYPYDSLTIATLIAVFIHAQFNHSLFYPWVMVWIWVIMGSTNYDKN